MEEIVRKMKDGMTDADVQFLSELMEQVAHLGVVFIEVGSWKGHSTSILGKLAKECCGHVFCVDHWKGSPGVPQHELEEDCLATFKANMKALELEDVVHPLVMESALATSIIRDEVADMLFIDADHRYYSVAQDIELWSPKVKRGGILCGHDCEKYLEDYNITELGWILGSLHEDYLDRLNCHAGVIAALHDSFGRNYNKKEGSSIWYKKIQS